jgi:hypothetical protein
MDLLTRSFCPSSTVTFVGSAASTLTMISCGALAGGGVVGTVAQLMKKIPIAKKRKKFLNMTQSPYYFFDLSVL